MQQESVAKEPGGDCCNSGGSVRRVFGPPGFRTAKTVHFFSETPPFLAVLQVLDALRPGPERGSHLGHPVILHFALQSDVPPEGRRGRRQCLSHERQWKHGAKAVSWPRRQLKHAGKGSVCASKAAVTHKATAVSEPRRQWKHSAEAVPQPRRQRNTQGNTQHKHNTTHTTRSRQHTAQGRCGVLLLAVFHLATPVQFEPGPDLVQHIRGD